eukprot:30215-Eustigmatos_ZCMA.PRE.1
MDLSFNALRSVAVFAQCQWAVSLQVLFLRSNELRSTRYAALKENVFMSWIQYTTPPRHDW